ncbi:MAG: hypothetical protein HQM10_02670 [Candidatus Riflebacteria bacterium]|nr:hypothetical protein [Candidatus Riflebacteria bacterium]
MRNILFYVLIFISSILLFGFTQSNDPGLRNYSRTTLNTKLNRLQVAGEDFYKRRLYEEAIGVFEAMLILDRGNLDAYYWIKKSQERIDREKSEKNKAELYQKKGSLVIKESKFDNWIWGPTAGHFEVRVSKPKPRIIPPKKDRARVSDSDVEKLLAEAKKSPSASNSFELAMAYKSRSEYSEAIEWYLKAAELDRKILELDDEGLTGELSEKYQAAKENGQISPPERLRAASVNFIQGDFPESVIDYIKSASKDPTLKLASKSGLEKIIGTGRTEFLQTKPEILSFRQAYLWENGEDSVYLKIRFRPTSPLFLVPFELPIDYENLKTVEIRSENVLYIIPDKTSDNPLRLWVACKDIGDSIPVVEMKAVLRLKPSKLIQFDFSNYYCIPETGDNWSVVLGDNSTFCPGFMKGTIESTKEGLMVKAFDLYQSKGRGPTLDLRDFRRNLGKSVNVWKIIDEVLP